MAHTLRPTSNTLVSPLPHLRETVCQLSGRLATALGAPGLRPSALIYVLSFAIAAIGVLAVGAAKTDWPNGERGTLAVLVTATLVGIRLFPLSSVARTKLCLDSAILLAAVLIFPPSTAMLITAVGTIVPAMIQRHPWCQTIFNSGALVLIAGAGSGALMLFHWRVEWLAVVRFEAVLIALGVGAGVWVLNLLIVASMVSLQEAEPLPRIAVGMVRGDGRTGLIVQAAEIGLGVGLAALAGGLGMILIAGTALVICAAVARRLLPLGLGRLQRMPA